MSFRITFFGPKHYWWRSQTYRGKNRVWFYRPDKDSTGAVGFCIPGLHVMFSWGRT